MIGIIIWSVLVLLIIGGGFYFIVMHIKNTMGKEFKYSLNLHKEGFERTNFPLIKLRIRNKYKYFLVDSGANVNTIADSCYKDIVGKGVVMVTGEQSVYGVGTTEDVKPVTIVQDVISIGRDKFTEEFRLLDNWEPARKLISDKAGVQVVGILGSAFFKKAKWVLDFEELVIWVKK